MHASRSECAACCSGPVALLQSLSTTVNPQQQEWEINCFLICMSASEMRLSSPGLLSRYDTLTSEAVRNAA